MPQFEVEVGGNIAPVTKSIADLKSRLKELKFEIEKSTDSKAIAVLNAELRKTEEELKRIKGVGTIIPPAATKSVQSATFALTNLGRVAQDAPYGFIGIANNLNPLLESFQRLRQETGSNKAALSALVGSLRGAGGIGLALSLFTSALQFASLGLQAWTTHTKKAKDEADKLAETLKSLKNATELGFEAEGDMRGQVIQIQALAQAVADETRSQKERARALEQLKGINKEYFGDLTLQEESLKRLTALVDEYTQAIIAQAVVKELSSEIGKIGAAFARQTAAVSRAKDALQSYKDGLNISAVDKAGNRTFVLDKNIDKLNEDLRIAQKELAPTAEKYNELANELKAATEATLKFRNTNSSGAGSKKEEDLLKKRLEALERIKKVTTDVNDLVTIQEAIFELKVKIAVRDDKKRLSGKEFDQLIKGYQDELNEVFLKQAISLEAIPKVTFSPVALAEIPQVITDRISKATGNEKITITLHDVRVKFLGAKKTKLIEDKEAINAQLSKEINESLQNLQIDLTGTFAEQLGEAFGNALQGGDLGEGLRNAAKAMLGVLGSTMQQIGRQVIAAAIKIKLLKETLEKWAIANPGLAILAGAGLIAAGAALKATTFSGPKFAKGGIVTGPTIGMMGEAGPEAILPLNKLGSMIGNKGATNVVLKGSLAIRGRELVAFLEQEQTKFNRIK